MDESAKLFQEEQERFAQAGGIGPWFKQQLWSRLIATVVFISVMVALMGAIGTFPRNSDNSIKMVYVGPAFVVLGLSCLTTLRRLHSVPPWMKPTLWALMALSVVIVPVAVIDLILWNGG
ncbi:MAG: hypothetical protein K2W86_11645 [Sphingomonas sp.]|uniref:hypothetical protein n=1 Tax=Sphingomonas sp. TaxID=28214 RepID=UPI0035A968B6|nr:hypothetical protein [Sphingomonas sp.]